MLPLVCSSFGIDFRSVLYGFCMFAFVFSCMVGCVVYFAISVFLTVKGVFLVACLLWIRWLLFLEFVLGLLVGTCLVGNCLRPFRWKVSSFGHQNGLERCLAMRETSLFFSWFGHDGASFMTLLYFDKNTKTWIPLARSYNFQLQRNCPRSAPDTV